MYSMTGFGQATVETSRLRVTVTLRSVNHRFLDLSLRLRDDERPLEPLLRERLGARLSRGRVEVGLEARPVHVASAVTQVDEELATAVAAAAKPLVASGAVSCGPTFGDLMRLPDVVRIERAAVSWDADSRQDVLAALDQALDELTRARAVEGGSLSSVLEEHLDGLESLTESLRVSAKGVPLAAAANLETRLRALLGSSEHVDPSRLAQEVAVLADRSDVREELDRLASHVEHFRRLMAEEGAVGKKLDFLAQELFRELNTTGAKCRDAGMTRLVLEAKSRCEQIREQVQNVE